MVGPLAGVRLAPAIRIWRVDEKVMHNPRPPALYGVRSIPVPWWGENVLTRPSWLPNSFFTRGAIRQELAILLFILLIVRLTQEMTEAHIEVALDCGHETVELLRGQTEVLLEETFRLFVDRLSREREFARRR
jgi:hypothetical protein